MHSDIRFDSDAFKCIQTSGTHKTWILAGKVVSRDAAIFPKHNKRQIELTPTT
jgi:hypothetical protein